MTGLPCVVVLIAVISTAAAKLFSDPSQLTKTKYDYVVIGGELPFPAVLQPILSNVSYQLELEEGLLPHVFQRIYQFLCYLSKPALSAYTHHS